MHHLETLIQAIPPAVFAAGGLMPSIPPSHQASDGTTSPTVPFMNPEGIVPPPSLHVFPLMNPSTHFTRETKVDERHHSPHSSGSFLNGTFQLPSSNPEHLAEESSRMSLAASYLYFDDEGYTRWQGETSGLPVLDLLVEQRTPMANLEPEPIRKSRSDSNGMKMTNGAANGDWFPDRQPRRTDVNPQTLWRLITSYIAPELMDRRVTHIDSFISFTNAYLALFNAIYRRHIIFSLFCMSLHFYR
jgi:hypothetical protein